MKTIGFIGGGKMGEAIFSGLIRTGACSAGDIAVSCRTNEKCSVLEAKYPGVRTYNTSGEEGVAGFARQSALIVVHRRVVGVHIRLFVLRDLLRHIEHPLQIRLEHGEIALLFRLVPDCVGFGGELRILYKDLLRNAAYALETAHGFGYFALHYRVERVDIGGEGAYYFNRFRRGRELI